MMKHLIAPFLLLIVGLGCNSMNTIESTRVKSDSIYQSYSIETTKDSTKIIAVMRQGGSWGETIDLDLPSSIQYNGKEIPESGAGILKGTDYRVEFNRFIGQHSFNFTDPAGKVWVNNVSGEPFELRLNETTVSRQKDFVFSFSRPIVQTDRIEVVIESAKPNPNLETGQNSNNKNEMQQEVYYIAVTGKLGSDNLTVTIPAYELKDFVTGKAFISVKIIDYLNPVNSAGGGNIEITHTAPKLTVNVVN